MPMPIHVEATEFPGVFEIATGCIGDDRGFFSESYSKPVWDAAGLAINFLQDNLSLSRKGTLRGMHYQINPDGMGKLVRVVRGSVFDVGIDLRKGSPTFGKWIGRELSETNRLALWLPAGFAHGFLALEDDTLVYYKCDACHTPQSERAVRYNDAQVGIQWPIPPTVISPKDAAAPDFKDAEKNFVFGG